MSNKEEFISEFHSTLTLDVWPTDKLVQIWPILQAAKNDEFGKQKLPILVFFSSKSSHDHEGKQHQKRLEFAILAHKLNCIVVDFNYRTGLLGKCTRLTHASLQTLCMFAKLKTP